VAVSHSAPFSPIRNVKILFAASPQSKAGAPPQAAKGMCHCSAEQPTAQNLYSNTLNTIFSALPRKKRAYSTGGFAQLGGSEL